MEIKIMRNQRYKSVEIHDGGTLIDCGLLDDEEQMELADELLSAVEDLLPDSRASASKLIAAIREEIF